MAITLDWGNKIINIAKSSPMTLIQSMPTEIWQLDLNVFRNELNDLQDSPEGMPFDTTHRHVAPITVSGVQLARVVELINDYTITFEDGQYAVNLVGANSNLGDRVNVNQVSVRTANSAGLVTSAAIEFGEYGGAVTVDVNAEDQGTIYPAGTLRQPVSNMNDAMVIASARGFSTIQLISDYTFTTGDNVSGMIIRGINPTRTSVIVEDGADVTQCSFKTMEIEGILDGGNTVEKCQINDLVYFNGVIRSSTINTSIVLGGGAIAQIYDSFSGIPGFATPYIDMGGSGQSLALRSFSGGIEIRNKTGSDDVSLDFISGHAIITDTVTDGDIVIRGNVKVTDESTGTAVVEMDSVILSETGYNGAVSLDTTTGQSGLLFPAGTATRPVMTLADAEVIATQYNLRGLIVSGTLTTDRNLINYDIRGNGAVQSNTFIFAGHDCSLSQFYRMTLAGTVTGSNMQYEDCILSNVTGVDGLIDKCGIAGSLNFTGSIIGRDASLISNPTDFNFMSSATASLQLAIETGDMILTNMIAGSGADLNMNAGTLVIDSSCTGGTILVGGQVDVTDNSGGAVTIISDTNTERVWSYERI